MRLVTGGATSVINYFQMRLTAGGDATGLTIADFDMTYTRTGATPAAKVDAVALAAANTAWTSGRGIEVDPTDAPGLYRFDFPDAAFAAGVDEVVLTIKHASCFTESLRVEIDGEVNVTKVSGDSTAADNLELDYDGTGYDKSNSTIGTTTTNTDMRGTDGANTTVPDAAGTAAVPGDLMGLANDAITSAKYDESTAFPVKSADTGATQIARTGADGDTLETLSDEIAVVDGNVDSILVDTTQIKADLPIKITKNAAYTNFMFKMVDSTDGYTEETGLSVTATRSLGGAAFGACANAVSEVSDGWYKIDLDAADTNGDPIILRFTATGARDTEFIIIPQKTT